MHHVHMKRSTFSYIACCAYALMSPTMHCIQRAANGDEANVLADIQHPLMQT